MTDIKISVGARDEGASALIDKIIAALNRLADARRTLAALEGQSQARDAQGRFLTKEATEAAKARAQAEVSASKAIVAALRDIINASKEAERAERAKAQAAIAAAKQAQASASAQAAASRATAAQATASAAASRSAAAASNAQAAASRAAGSTAQANARIQASASQAQAAASRLATAQVQQQTRAASALASAQLQQARAQQQAQRIAAQQAAAAQRQQLALIRSANDGNDIFGKFRNTILRWAAAFEGVSLFGRFIKEGVTFNQILETATLGIASIITATNDVSDANSKVLQGADALRGAYALAADQIQKIRIAGLETAATTEQLVEAFQSATGPGLAAGLTLDQVRTFSVQIVQAAAAIGVPMTQLNQEVRSILDKTIDRNSRIAKTVGITNENIRQWQEQNILAQKLNEKMASFTTAGKEAAKTLQVVRSNLKEAFQVFAGQAVQPLFEALRVRGFQLLQQIFDTRNLKVADNFQPIVEALQGMFGGIAKMVIDLVDAAIRGLTELGQWFKRNQTEVEDLARSVGALFRAIGDLIANIFKVVAAILRWNTEHGTLSAAIKDLADFIEFTANPVMITLIGTIAIGVKVWKEYQQAQAAAAAGQTLFLATPLGRIVTVIAGALALASFAYEKYAQSARIAAERQKEQQNEFIAHQANVVRLASKYLELVQASQELGITEDERARRMNDLAKARNALITADSTYAGILHHQNDAYKDQQKLVLDLTKAKLEHLKAVNDENVAALNQLKVQESQAEQAAKQAQIEVDAFNKLLNEGHLSSFDAKELARQNQILENSKKLANSLKSGIAVLEPQINAFGASVGLAFDEFLRAQADMNRVALKPKPRDITTPGSKNDAKQMADAAISEIKAALKESEASLKASLASHQISFQDYFDTLQRLQTEAAKKEVAVLHNLLNQTTDAGDRAKILAEINNVFAERRQASIENNAELIKLQQDLNKDIANAQAELLRAQGRQAEAALAKQESRYAEDIAQLKANRAQLIRVERETGQSRAGEIKKVNDQIDVFEKLAQRERIKAAEEGAKADADLIRSEIGSAAEAIKQMHEDGAISAEEANDRTVAAYADGITKIMQLIARVNSLRVKNLSEVFLQKSEKENNISQIQQQMDAAIEDLRTRAKTAVDFFNLQIEGAKGQQRAKLIALRNQTQAQLDIDIQAVKDAASAKIDAIKQQIQELIDQSDDPAFEKGMRQLLDALTQVQRGYRGAVKEQHAFRDELLKVGEEDVGKGLNIIGDTLGAIIVQNKTAIASLKDAWGDFALSVIQDIQRIIEKLLAYKLVTSLLSASGFESLAKAIPNPFGGGKAGGGLIRGPGGPTSDSILTPLSNGEYVIRASVVQRLGVPFFDLINRGVTGVPAMRRNPHNGMADGGFVEARNISGKGVIEVRSDPESTIRLLESSLGVQIQINNTRRNRKSFRTILGVDGK